MTTIDGIYFPDEEFTSQEVLNTINKKKLKFRIVDTNKDLNKI